MQWGKAHYIEAFQAWERKGDPAEEWTNRPRLGLFGRKAWACFNQLHAGRDMGMAGATGQMPPVISEMRIESWARMHGIQDPEGQTELYDLVRHLDFHWRDLMEARSVQDRAEAGMAPKPAKR